MKNKKNAILIILLMLVIIIAAVVVVKEVNLKNAYAEAFKLQGSGYYDEAIESFIKLDDYKDSQVQIKETLYLKAENEVVQKKYSNAIQIYQQLGNYKDSESILENLNTYVINGTIEVKLNGRTSCSLIINTNLIDGTIVAIQALSLFGVLEGETFVSEWIPVKNGQVECSFAIPNNWKTGDHKILCSVEMNNKYHPQPKYVTDLYGNEGSKLLGDLVKYSDDGNCYISFEEKKLGF